VALGDVGQGAADVAADDLDFLAGERVAVLLDIGARAVPIWMPASANWPTGR